MIHGTHNAIPDERNKDILIYVNGELFKREEAKISVFDSGYLVGDGIWEAMRLHNGVLVSAFRSTLGCFKKCRHGFKNGSCRINSRNLESFKCQ